MRMRVSGVGAKNKPLLPEKCAHSDINSLGMTASKNMGQSPKRGDTPLWRRKANYVLRELVRAWHGLPYDTAVIWGLRYAFEDILHTFAKENDLPIPKLLFWFEHFWQRFSGYLVERVFSASDRVELMDIMLQGFPPSRAGLCKSFFHDPSIYGIMRISSMIFLRAMGKKVPMSKYGRWKWDLRKYENLEVASLDSFVILEMKRILNEQAET